MLSGPKLPTEIFVEIFDFVLETGEPRLTLALVCKYWLKLIWNCPKLWRRLSLRMKYRSWTNYTGNMLKSRIARSGNVELEVVLDAYYFIELDHDKHLYTELHRVLATSGLHRWKSLVISRVTRPELTHPSPGFVLPAGTIKGSLTNLRKVNIESLMSHVHLWPLIVQSSAPIQSLELDGSWAGNADNIYASDLFSPSLLTFKGPYQPSTMMSLPASITELYITTPIDSAWLSIVFTQICALPSLNVFSLPNCYFSHLSALEATSVQHLLVGYLFGDGISLNQPITASKITHLSVGSNSLTSITRLDAPRLRSLTVGTLLDTTHTDSIRDALVLFRDLSHLIYIAPTKFHTYMLLPREAVYFILERWPQLEDLLLTIGPRFPWRTSLGSALQATRITPMNPIEGSEVHQSWKTCPNLRVLRLRTCWCVEESVEWREIAERVIVARRTGPLHSIYWTYGLMAEMKAALSRSDIL